MTLLSHRALHDADATYAWKLVFRLLAFVFGIIGIGSIGWAFNYHPMPQLPPSSDTSTTTQASQNISYFYDDKIYLPWSFISLSASVLWNSANVGVLLARKGQGIHPGVNVGCDLVLWMAFLVTGVYALFGAFSVNGYWTGSYYPNGGAIGGSSGNATGADVLCPAFLNCQAQTDYYNAMQRKSVVIMLGVAMSFLALLIHFSLFISACRYTNARNQRPDTRYAKAITEEATVLARKMISDMTSPGGGFILVNSEGQIIQPVQQQQQHDEENPEMAQVSPPLVAQPWKGKSREPQPQQEQHEPQPSQAYTPGASDGTTDQPTYYIPSPKQFQQSETSAPAAGSSNYHPSSISSLPPQITIQHPPLEGSVHPALREQDDRIEAA